MSTKILGIDVGSFQICAVIAQHDENGIKIIGIGTEKTQGIKKGVITNIELASKSIKNALLEAQRVAGTHYEKVVVSISGAYTKSVNSSGVVNIPNHEIGIREIERAMQMADHTADIPHEYEKLHVLPYNFKVDGQEHIEDPIGMNGTRLEVQTHIVTVQKSSLSNLRKAINSAGIQIDNIVLSGYASAIATLTKDEKELGAVLIDMGGATCNMVVHSGNSIRFNEFLGVGSANITNDLSMALHTPLPKAEDIKINYGALINKSVDLIELPILGDEAKTHEVSLDIISNVIYARAEETLMILAKIFEDSGYKDMIGAGVVLTGGMTKLEGLRDLASAIFDKMSVRIAKPKETDGLYEIMRDPANSCAIGLCMYGAGEFTAYEIDSEKKMRYHGEAISKPKPSFKNVFEEEKRENLNFKRQESNPFEEEGIELVHDDLRLDIQKPSSKEELANIADISKQEKQPSAITKFWHRITQLF
ncbi:MULTISPECIES: cell division protein FtsA [Campylobacter]|uniref:Cell division protein FtsA n=3 Tax=Campylobacter curvus TaxID=200 RepID=A7GYX9_CAMC5|nr:MULTISPECIES: cell division protein FtsA [Campylobacter]EAU00264.1 cell division protein FtsA [Campylobacter curvus 525.92]EJP74578.1 cell division protein FtsA [Campylobacter sp. FOBRC14]